VINALALAPAASGVMVRFVALRRVQRSEQNKLKYLNVGKIFALEIFGCIKVVMQLEV